MRHIAPLLLGLGFAGLACAEPVRYGFDKVHTQIHASVSHLGLSNSTARFHVKDGSLLMDPEDLASSQLDVTIDAGSIDLGDATWKDHLSGEKWFNLASFPEIRYVSTAVHSEDGKSLRIEGELTLLGVTRPVSLQATLNGSGPHPFSKKPAAGFSATASFNRSDFGMDHFVPNVGDEVTVRIEVEVAAS